MAQASDPFGKSGARIIFVKLTDRKEEVMERFRLATAAAEAVALGSSNICQESEACGCFGREGI